MNNDNTSSEPANIEQPFLPLSEITLISTPGRSVGASIQPNGDLLVSGLDWGAGPNAAFGGDYEYSVTIAAEFKDSFLLLLLGQHFKDFPEFRVWLEAENIPFTAWSWSG
jgi:hypothetical protein